MFERRKEGTICRHIRDIFSFWHWFWRIWRLFEDYHGMKVEPLLHVCGIAHYTWLSPVPELSFLPSPCRGWTRASKGESRVTCMCMLRTNQSKITRSQARCSRGSRSEKRKPFLLFDVVIVVKKRKVEIWFIVICTLIDNEYVSLLFSQTCFSYCFCILSEFPKLFEGNVWRVQLPHLHHAASALLRAILRESEAKLEMKKFNPPSIFVWR